MLFAFCTNLFAPKSNTVCFSDWWLPTKCKLFLTPVFNSVFNALSHGALRFALHGSSYIHFLIGWNSSTANHNISIYCFFELPNWPSSVCNKCSLAPVVCVCLNAMLKKNNTDAAHDTQSNAFPTGLLLIAWLCTCHFWLTS